MKNRANSYKGQESTILFQQWGPPDKTSTDGGAGKIYTYVRSMQFSFGYYTGYSHFYVNVEGVVYHVMYKYTII